MGAKELGRSSKHLKAQHSGVSGGADDKQPISVEAGSQPRRDP